MASWRSGAFTWSWRIDRAGSASWPPRSAPPDATSSRCTSSASRRTRGSVTDELLVRVPAGIDPSVLIIAAARIGAPCTLHVPADATELSDPVTTALALARMVAADPGSAPRAVATLLHARLVDPAAAPAAGPAHPPAAGRRAAPPARPGWPFTATELSRAAALLELAAQLALSAPSAGSRASASTACSCCTTAPRCCCARPARRTRRSSPRCTRAARPSRGARGSSARCRAWTRSSCATWSTRTAGARCSRSPRDGGSAVGLADLRLSTPCPPSPGPRPSACSSRTPGSTAAWAPRWCGGRRDRRRARAERAHRHRPRGRGPDHPAAAPGRPAPDGGARRRHAAAQRPAGDPRRDGVVPAFSRAPAGARAPPTAAARPGRPCRTGGGVRVVAQHDSAPGPSVDRRRAPRLAGEVAQHQQLRPSPRPAGEGVDGVVVGQQHREVAVRHRRLGVPQRDQPAVVARRPSPGRRPAPPR